MKPRVFRPYRKRKGKRERGPTYHLRYKLAGDAKPTEVSLQTTDERVAHERAAKIVREAEHERAGLLPPKLMRDSASRPLTEHLADYAGDLRVKGRAAEYVYNVQCLAGKVIGECAWATVRDVTADSFVTWRAQQQGKAAKTLNEYLNAVAGLCAWMCRQGRLVANPLREVQKVDSRDAQVRPRRALTEQETARLIAVAPAARRLAYMIAVHTGLRRSEIASLQWGRVHLNAPVPFITARARTTKSKREAVLPLHPELVAELQEWADGVGRTDRVVDHVPTVPEMRIDLERAGVAFVDEAGERADFHALRKTCGTNLALAGVLPTVSKEFMRHSDVRLTMEAYTDAKLLPVAGVVDRLPSFVAQSENVVQIATGTDDVRGTQKCSSISGAGGQSVTERGTERAVMSAAKSSSGSGESHELTLCGTSERESCESRGSRIRT